MERRNKSYSWEERGGHQESRSTIGKEKRSLLVFSNTQIPPFTMFLNSVKYEKK